jgi:hypothetical protein
MVIWYVLWIIGIFCCVDFCIFYPVLECCNKKIWQPLWMLVH